MVYAIIGEAFNKTADIQSILNLVDAFSADDTHNMNLAEFSTMMRYMGECGEIARYFSGDEEDNKVDPKKRIEAAIKIYEQSKKAIQDRLVEQLGPINSIITMKDLEIDDCNNDPNPMDIEFNSVYGPDQMRCLALVSRKFMSQTDNVLFLMNSFES